jgi:hypothetical protein
VSKQDTEEQIKNHPNYAIIKHLMLEMDCCTEEALPGVLRRWGNSSIGLLRKVQKLYATHLSTQALLRSIENDKKGLVNTSGVV